jgi:hypothetical protein
MRLASQDGGLGQSRRIPARRENEREAKNSMGRDGSVGGHAASWQKQRTRFLGMPPHGEIAVPVGVNLPKGSCLSIWNQPGNALGGSLLFDQTAPSAELHGVAGPFLFLIAAVNHHRSMLIEATRASLMLIAVMARPPVVTPPFDDPDPIGLAGPCDRHRRPVPSNHGQSERRPHSSYLAHGLAQPTSAPDLAAQEMSPVPPPFG